MPRHDNEGSFAAVNAAAVRLSSEIGGHRWISILGVVLCAAAFGALVWQTIREHPSHLAVLGGMLVLAFGVELGYRELRDRKLSL